MLQSSTASDGASTTLAHQCPYTQAHTDAANTCACPPRTHVLRTILAPRKPWTGSRFCSRAFTHATPPPCPTSGRYSPTCTRMANTRVHSLQATDAHKHVLPYPCAFTYSMQLHTMHTCSLLFSHTHAHVHTLTVRPAIPKCLGYAALSIHPAPTFAGGTGLVPGSSAPFHANQGQLLARK